MPKNILLVDDDEDDVQVFSEALLQLDPAVKITVAENGLKALDYLNSDYALPCLIVLDINMPYLDGKQTFQKIKANPQLENVPIVIFTSSINPADKNMFDELGINFITKPHTILGINYAASTMLNYC